MPTDLENIYNAEAAKCAAEGITVEATSLRCLRAVEAAVMEACAKICEKRAEDRFEAYGTREFDTNAAYYTGTFADSNETMDEEDEECAAAIRAMGRAG